MNKHQLCAFIIYGGTVGNLRNILKTEFWKPRQFAAWCVEAADSLTPHDSTFAAHANYMTAAEMFDKFADSELDNS